MAAPPAPAMMSAVTIGPASRTTASTEAAPVNDCAPSWRTSEPSCSAMTAPNGIDTSAAGRIEHELMNQACWIELARPGTAAAPMAAQVSRQKAKNVPALAQRRRSRTVGHARLARGRPTGDGRP